jgi:hypothetical protein
LENYRTARNEAKQTLKEAKENSWIEFGEETESNYQRNNHRFWKVLKSIRGKYGKQVRSVKNRNNVLVTKSAEVLAVWKDYFEEKFGRVELERQCKRREVKDKDREEGIEMENGIANIDRAEVEEAVGRITLWKAAGTDYISPELIKYGGNKLIDEMTKLFRQAWEEKKHT